MTSLSPQLWRQGSCSKHRRPSERHFDCSTESCSWEFITDGDVHQDKLIYSGLLDADRAGVYPMAMGCRVLQAAEGVGGMGAAPSS